MTSFASFFRTNKYPRVSIIRTLLAGPLTGMSLFLYALFTAILVVVYILIIRINSNYLITVPARGGTITEGIIGSSIDSTLNAFLYNEGPYKVKKTIVSNGITKEIILKRNKKIPSAFSDEIHFKIFANQSELITALENGSIDTTIALSSDTELPPSIQNDYTIIPVPTPATVTLYRNNADTVLTNQQFISILDDFIDKNAIIATVEHGYGTLTRYPAVAPATIEDTVAKLGKAGFLYKNGSLTHNGTPVGFALAVENDTHMLGAARALADSLGHVGIIVSIKAYDAGTFENSVKNSEYSAFLATTTDVTIPSTYHSVLALYTRSQPFIIKKSIYGAHPETLQNPYDHYARMPSWYSETDRLWPWVARLLHKSKE